LEGAKETEEEAECATCRATTKSNASETMSKLNATTTEESLSHLIPPLLLYLSF